MSMSIATDASSSTLGAPPLLHALPGAPRSRKTPRSAAERARRAAGEARKAERELSTRSLGLSDEVEAAYADLNHALLLAHERGQEVPCRGRGGEAWTSDEYDDQQVAADRCLDCPAMALCKQYADVAGEVAGTWGGVTRGPARPVGRSRDAVRARRLAGRACECDCGGRTRGGRFLPGHDSRRVAQLVGYVRAGAISRERALSALEESPALRAKLIRFLDGR